MSNITVFKKKKKKNSAGLDMRLSSEMNVLILKKKLLSLTSQSNENMKDDIL